MMDSVTVTYLNSLIVLFIIFGILSLLMFPGRLDTGNGDKLSLEDFYWRCQGWVLYIQTRVGSWEFQIKSISWAKLWPCIYSKLSAYAAMIFHCDFAINPTMRFHASQSSFRFNALLHSEIITIWEVADLSSLFVLVFLLHISESLNMSLFGSLRQRKPWLIADSEPPLNRRTAHVTTGTAVIEYAAKNIRKMVLWSRVEKFYGFRCFTLAFIACFLVSVILWFSFRHCIIVESIHEIKQNGLSWLWQWAWYKRYDNIGIF